MMIAVTVVLILMTWYVPFFSVIGMFICGVPMACLVARNGWKTTAIALVGVFAVTFLVTGSILSAVSMMLMSILPGAVAGVCLGKEINFFTTLLITCLAVCIGWLFEVFVIDNLIHGEGIDAMLNEMLSQFRQIFEATMANLPAEMDSGELQKAVEETIEMMSYMFRLYFPSIVIVSSMIIGYVIVRFCSFFIKRLKIRDIYTVPFSMLKAPKSMCFAAVVLYLISIFGNKDGAFWAVSANVVLILYTIIGICGLSLLDNKLSKKIPKGGVRALIYAALFLLGGGLVAMAANLLVIVGIIDSSHNFRKISEGDQPFEGGDGGGWV